jgi:hypothetical protein
MNPATWLLVVCFGSACLGPDTRIVSGLTQGQCFRLAYSFNGINKNKALAEAREFLGAHCYDPRGNPDSDPLGILDARADPLGLKSPMPDRDPRVDPSDPLGIRNGAKP